MKTTLIFCLFCGVSKTILASILATLLFGSPPLMAGEAEKVAGPTTEAEERITETKSTDSSDSNGVKDEINVYYMKGKERVLEGKFDEAAPLLELALKADPNSAFLNHQLAQVFLQLGNFEKAEGYARKSVELEGKNVEFRTTFGGILASNKKFNDAKEQYTKVMELEPGNNKAPLYLGILEAESGQMDKGIAVLSKVITESPENVMALFYRAKIYLELEKIEEAKLDLDKCVTLRPGFVEAGTALGLIYERLNTPDEAIKVYSRIQGSGQFRKRLAILHLQKNETDKALENLLEYEASQPDDYTARVKIGLIYFEMKKYGLAKEKFLSVLKEQKDADNVRFYLGWVYEEEKAWNSALDQFKKVSKDSNLFKEAMLHVGFIYKETGKVNEGLDFAKKLLLKNGEVAEFYDLNASFLEAQKNYKKALEVIAQGIKKFPEDEKLLYFEGALYDKTGNKKKGISNMQKILGANPNNAHALNFLAYTYAEMGTNLEEAQTYVTKALSLKPNDGFIEDSAGWIFFRQGKHDLAIEHLEKAAKLQPEEAVIFEHLGDVYQAKKEIAKAEEYYKKAVTFSAKKDKEMSKKIEGKLAALQGGPSVDKKEKRVPSSGTTN